MFAVFLFFRRVFGSATCPNQGRGELPSFAELVNWIIHLLHRSNGKFARTHDMPEVILSEIEQRPDCQMVILRYFEKVFSYVLSSKSKRV